MLEHMSHLRAVPSSPVATAIEFFAGIGLARAGMAEAGIHTIWANDYDLSKQKMYAQQWGADTYQVEDVFKLDASQVPTADLAWSSSPCTDLSLAGKRSGIGGAESSAFFGFTNVLREMESRRPSVVVLENVNGLASSHGGDDLRAAIHEFNDLGYAVDAVTIDARRFVPQSRPRLFVIGAVDPIDGGTQDTTLRPDLLSWVHEDQNLRTFHYPFPVAPAPLTDGFTALTENISEEDPRWWDEPRVSAFFDSMSPTQRDRADSFISGTETVARTAYRRTRNGVPTWEMRSQDISGCLRTARGGSSKQAVAFMGKGQKKVRWMTGLEYARLMGAGWYNINGLRESQTHYGFGDAVAVPVVSWLANEALLPLIKNTREGRHREHAN